MNQKLIDFVSIMPNTPFEYNGVVLTVDNTNYIRRIVVSLENIDVTIARPATEVGINIACILIDHIIKTHENERCQ